MKKILLLALVSLSTSAFAQICQVDMVNTRNNRVLDTFQAYGGNDCFEGMKECRKEIRLRSLLNKADCVRRDNTGGYNPYPDTNPYPTPIPTPRPTPVGSYKLARSQDGSTNCFMTDAYGTAFGYPVEAINCMYTHMLGTAKDGSLNCYMADINRTAYGMPVDGSLCMRGYRIGTSRDGSRRCYMSDETGTAYGMPVSDYLCQGRY